MSSELHFVILAGGAGTRFWPASRRLRPKQLLPLAPDAAESLLAQTQRRLRALAPPERFLVATGAHLIEATRAALPELPPEAFLAEPVARNTAACIGLATSRIARAAPEATVAVLPSDHHIAAPEAFRECLRTAERSAATGVITTIGIRPTRPETGYGYIELGEATPEGWVRAKRFVEKPERARAEEYVASGRFLWNAGMFVFRAQDMLAAIESHLPALHRGLMRIEEAATTGGTEAEVRETAAVFEALESISVDHGVMEKLQTLHVVPGDFGWSDLGSWQARWELAAKDEHGNALPPGSVAYEASGNLVVDARRRPAADEREAQAGHRYALLGVEGLCIVETDDVTLVVPRARAQDVAQLLKHLEAHGAQELL